MKKRRPSPPGLFLRFFRWFCHPDLKNYIEGDLMELYQERLIRSQKRNADFKFIIDVALLFRPGIIKPLELYQPLNFSGMLKNNFKVGFRNLLKYKAFSFINISGLGVAMSVCMLIILMLVDQKSYDQFHEKKDRTYRILSKIQRSGTPNASSPFPLATFLKENYPIIETSTHLVPGVGGDDTYEQKSTEMRGYFADASFFDVFGFDLVSGNRSSALVSPNSMVISAEKALQLFNGENPIGKTIQFYDRGLRIIHMNFGNEMDSPLIDWGSYTITGVMDTRKYKSHLKFDALVSTTSLEGLYREQKRENFTNNWQRYSYCYTYVVTNPDHDDLELAASLDASPLSQKAHGGLFAFSM